jgi:hypothetical protein
MQAAVSEAPRLFCPASIEEFFTKRAGSGQRFSQLDQVQTGKPKPYQTSSFVPGQR